MPITKQLSDGSLVEFADDTPSGTIDRIIARENQALEASKGPDIASDVVGGLLETGPANLFAGTLGAKHDFEELGMQGFDYAKRKVQEWLGLPVSQAREPQVPRWGSDYFKRKYAENVLGHDVYNPKTGWGKAAALATEFAPGMIGGTALPRAALGAAKGLTKRVVTQVAAPTAATLGAQELTDDPWAQMGAAVVAPSLARRGMNPGIIRKTPAQQAQVALLEREGVPLSAGDITGSPRLQKWESYGGARDVEPVSEGFYKNVSPAAQDKALTASTARTSPDIPSGTTEFLSPRGSMEFLPTITKKVGSEYDTVLAPYPATKIVGKGKSMKAVPLEFDERKQLARTLMGPADLAKLDDLDKRYATLKTLTEAQKGSGGVGAEGYLTPGAFWKASQDYPGGATEPLATAAQSVLKNRASSGMVGPELSHTAFTVAPGRQSAHAVAALLALGTRPLVMNRASQWWLKRPRPRATGKDLATGAAKSLMLRTTPARLPWEEDE